MLISFVIQLVAVSMWAARRVKDVKLQRRALKNCIPPTYFTSNRSGLQIPPVVWNPQFVTCPQEPTAVSSCETAEFTLYQIVFPCVSFHYKTPAQACSWCSDTGPKAASGIPILPSWMCLRVLRHTGAAVALWALCSNLSPNPIDSPPYNGDETSFKRDHCDVWKHVLLPVYFTPCIMQCIISRRGGFITGFNMLWVL